MKRRVNIDDRNWKPSLLPGLLSLVTTLDEVGNVNIAPKSWLSFVTDSIIAIGCTRDHHTAQNLLLNKECVLNMPGENIVQKVWDAAEFMEPCNNEPLLRGFTTIPSSIINTPSILECRAHMECQLVSVHWFGEEIVSALL